MNRIILYISSVSLLVFLSSSSCHNRYCNTGIILTEVEVLLSTSTTGNQFCNLTGFNLCPPNPNNNSNGYPDWYEPLQGNVWHDDQRKGWIQTKTESCTQVWDMYWRASTVSANFGSCSIDITSNNVKDSKLVAEFWSHCDFCSADSRALYVVKSVILKNTPFKTINLKLDYNSVDPNQNFGSCI